MLQRPPNNLLPLFAFFVFCSFRTLNVVVVSDPQTQLVSRFCDPYDALQVSNISIFAGNLNATFRDIRMQIREQNKHFATAQQANGGNAVATLFQCRNYLSVTTDCVACFDVSAARILTGCPAGSAGGFVVYDGCYLRYDTGNTFFSETTPSINSVRCGTQTADVEATAFDSTAQQVLTNLQTKTPTATGFFAATKMQVANNNNNNNRSVYAFAQCIETLTQNQCLSCLNAAHSNLQTCLPNSDGRAFANGCFMRYSTTSFFPDNQTFYIVPSIKQGLKNKKGTIIGVVAGGVAFVLTLLTLLAWVKGPKRPERSSVPRGDISGISKLKGPVIFSYRDLKLATKSFSEENKLGEGGFGAVYKGTLKNGKVVAVKKLTLRPSNKIEEEFESEVKLINNVHHRNLIRLLGCCSKGNERILIYEYMKNTSLDKFLFGKNRGSLNWKQRYDIILGTARGLAYLHEEFHVHIIHRDIKSNNILLDDDLQPRIADFGLARLLPDEKTHLSTKCAGTLGYTAPEYAIHGKLSEKADVYSYGVVVLEIISGQRSNELNMHGDGAGAFLLQTAWKLYERGMHMELVDNTLHPNHYKVEEVKRIIEIGLLCIQASAELRPTMSEVIVLLQGNGLLENMTPTMPILIETN